MELVLRQCPGNSPAYRRLAARAVCLFSFHAGWWGLSKAHFTPWAGAKVLHELAGAGRRFTRAVCQISLAESGAGSAGRAYWCCMSFDTDGAGHRANPPTASPVQVGVRHG